MIELLDNEQVKPIKFSDNKYLVSSYGRVFRTPTVMRPWYAELHGEINHGYQRVNLFINGKAKKYRVHRLVAMEFIDNTFNKENVNHIDGNKLNNNVKNLEWCTASENELHSYRVLGKEKWNTKPEHVKQKVIDLRKAGIKVKDICAMLDVSKSFVEKITRLT
jgi:hypothetical protein